MPNKSNPILFLSLYTFSLTGGVEKVCKNFILALQKLFDHGNWKSYSMHDKAGDFDGDYGDANHHVAFNGKKLYFITSAILKGLKANTIILSHSNLLLVAKVISLINSKKRFVMFAHGIEVWGELPQWKVNFIKKHVEVWAVSNFTKQVLLQKHGITKAKTLHNSLSPLIELPKTFAKPESLVGRYHINAEHPIIYTLTRLSSAEKYKGYDTVIAALANLKALGLQFTYLLAGKADAEEQLRIEQLIEANGLNANVKLIGYLPDDELLEHFLLADVFVMPSKGEGFGIVFIEAAAAGCQVIAGNMDGSTDALLHGKLGQLVNPTNEQEIADAILKAINNQTHQPKQQQALTVKHFGFDQYLANLEPLIHPERLNLAN
ncbi:glycosyltransferase family 4 protein [Pedobacter sp.]